MKSKFKLVFSLLVFSNLLLMDLLLLATPTNAQNAPANSSGSGVDSYQTPPVVYSGVEGSIRRLLCTPGISSDYAPDTSTAGSGPIISEDPTVTNPDSRDLAVCINRLYRFGAVLGAVAGTFFIALAGYFYILGGEHGKEKAKNMIFSVIAGLLVIFTAFILLRQINPEAVKFRTIQPPILTNVPKDLPSCEQLGLPSGCSIGARIAASGGGGTTPTTTPGPRGSGAVACCDIIPWSGPDPYDVNGVHWESTKAELKAAADATVADWKKAGNETRVTSAYRPQSYQEHSRSVWDAFKIICGTGSSCSKPGSGVKEVKGGYSCPSPQFDVPAPADLSKYTNDKAYMDKLKAEARAHGHYGDTRPACQASDHAKGVAVDFNAGNGLVGENKQFQTIAKNHGLCRNVQGDESHFVLIKYLSETETKKCIDF